MRGCSLIRLHWHGAISACSWSGGSQGKLWYGIVLLPCIFDPCVVKKRFRVINVNSRNHDQRRKKNPSLLSLSRLLTEKEKAGAAEAEERAERRRRKRRRRRRRG